MIPRTTMPPHRRFATLALAAAALCSRPGHTFAWSPKQAPLMTRFARDVDPEKTLPEYPRPQMVREEWLNLNGVWQYQPGKEGDPLPTGKKLDGEILVPFPVESALSGVMEHHERLWYRRTFTVPAKWRRRRVLLHFGAVDWETEIFVNGRTLGVHRGGYDPFSFDVTAALTEGAEQELVVRVYDPTNDYGQPRGKQTLLPSPIMYTPCTGIWQTVWLEPVPEAGIEDLRIVPDVDAGQLRLGVGRYASPGRAAAAPEPGTTLRVTIKDGGRTIGTREGDGTGEMRIPVPGARLWSPDDPFLYTLEVSLARGGETVDSVASYFGMRKIELGSEKGVGKMMLNGRFVFESGSLDQGYWPEGIYTQPTEAALKYDIEMMKRYGFNMVRKHLKVEPARWYYWCDKMGLLVWQDMPSPNTYADIVWFGTPDSWKKTDRKVPPVDAAAFEQELRQMVRTHWNAPSIILWDIFNEHQGQHDTSALVDMVKELDPSRLVNEASGDRHFGSGDVHDEHHYPLPGCPGPRPRQALACGEYGSIGLNIPGHLWANKGGGYTDVHQPEDLLGLYGEWSHLIQGFRDRQGLSAAVFTQLTDVETETNGLMTYDRVTKVDPAKIALANRFQYPEPAYRDLSPTSEKTARTWRYTTDTPPDGWEKAGFADAAWPEGEAAFGNGYNDLRTPWKAGGIWLRRHFDPGALTPEALDRLTIRSRHDESLQVYLNGVEALTQRGSSGGYENRPLSPAAKQALKAGADNVLAVHCQQKGGRQFIDVGLLERQPAEVP